MHGSENLVPKPVKEAHIRIASLLCRVVKMELENTKRLRWLSAGGLHG